MPHSLQNLAPASTCVPAKKLSSILKEKGASKVILCDLARVEVSYAVSDCFKYKRIIFASATHDAGIFPPMENLLLHLKSKNFQNRIIGILENGSWAPIAAKLINNILAIMKNLIVCDDIITIKSSQKTEDIDHMQNFADKFLKL